MVRVEILRRIGKHLEVDGIESKNNSGMKRRRSKFRFCRDKNR